MEAEEIQDKSFPTTQWSLISRARNADPKVQHEALSEICQLYWPPVYAFIRSRGYSPHDAEDLTQDFFAELLNHNDFAKANVGMGRLRSYLLTAIKNHLASEYRRNTCLKRGGTKVILSLDADSAETRCLIPQPLDEMTPEKVFERQWVITLMERVVVDLESIYAVKKQEALFIALKPYIMTTSRSMPQADIAEKLGMSEAALRVAVHRLKQRYANLLRQTVKSTLGEDENVETEISHMMTVF